jgi:hypothetical protein
MNNVRLLIALTLAISIGRTLDVYAEPPPPPGMPTPGAGQPTAMPAAAPVPGGAPSMPVATTPAGSGGVSLAAATPASAPRMYSYYGERFRDPFIPLLGDMRADTSLDRAPQIASLALKGIVQDAKGRMALLTSGINSYILRGGRLYDGRNRMVKKISGVIKTDSVVLIGADRTVRELRTKINL